MLMAILVLLVACHTNGQNLALNRPYTLSKAANYPGRVPTGDKTSLTDGKQTGALGRFWSNKTTVGWMKLDKVRITIDLGSDKPVGTVTFSTAAGTGGVYFPQNLYVFLSDDNKNFEFAGDIIDLSTSNSVDTSYGSYKREKFSLNEINRNARYVLIEAITRNDYLFSDEIEVMRSNKKIKKTDNALLYPKDKLDHAVDSIKFIGQEAEGFLRMINELPNEIITSQVIDRKNIKSQSIPAARDRINNEFSSYLQNKLQASWGISKYNTWDTLNQFYIPKSYDDYISFQLSLPENGAQYGSFTLTNSSKQEQEQELSVQISESNRSSHSFSLFEVPFVFSSGGRKIVDPLVPIGSKINIARGVTKLLFFKVESKKSGTYTNTISIAGKDREVSIVVNSEVRTLQSLKKSDELAANVWFYFSTPFAQKNKVEIAKDLHEHHINTIVIHPNAIPSLDETDFSEMENYLSGIGKFDKILLFANYEKERNKNGYKGGKFLSKEWKQYFTRWYGNLLKTLTKEGYSYDQVFLYPYDEVKETNEINDFINLIDWAKKNVRGIQFYATLQNPKAIKSLAPLVDVVQAHPTKELWQDLPSTNADIWGYVNGSPARELSPYSFYRLKSWRAFIDGLLGIGFWNYNTSGENSINKPLMNPNRDFSVVYTNNNTIYSSRRWEAFRLGLEDYWVLKNYSDKYGKQRALELAKAVVSHSNNLGMADSIRNMMLRSLSYPTQ